uniref:Uncharacterized protein n=1 Tax=Arundo donax TaxID=35708 RepID=A0A0A9DYE1_ARUDO
MCSGNLLVGTTCSFLFRASLCLLQGSSSMESGQWLSGMGTYTVLGQQTIPFLMRRFHNWVWMMDIMVSSAFLCYGLQQSE